MTRPVAALLVLVLWSTTLVARADLPTLTTGVVAGTPSLPFGERPRAQALDAGQIGRYLGVESARTRRLDLALTAVDVDVTVYGRFVVYRSRLTLEPGPRAPATTNVALPVAVPGSRRALPEALEIRVEGRPVELALHEVRQDLRLPGGRTEPGYFASLDFPVVLGGETRTVEIDSVYPALPDEGEGGGFVAEYLVSPLLAYAGRGPRIRVAVREGGGVEPGSLSATLTGAVVPGFGRLLAAPRPYPPPLERDGALRWTLAPGVDAQTLTLRFHASPATFRDSPAWASEAPPVVRWLDRVERLAHRAGATVALEGESPPPPDPDVVRAWLDLLEDLHTAAVGDDPVEASAAARARWVLRAGVKRLQNPPPIPPLGTSEDDAEDLDCGASYGRCASALTVDGADLAAAWEVATVLDPWRREVRLGYLLAALALALGLGLRARARERRATPGSRG